MSDAPFSGEELERYARHLVLPEIGGAGQQKLKRARLVMIGAGGLGAPALQYLAAAGVGTITIVDDDTVSLSNLQRQVLHTTPSVGMAKVESAKASLNAINPHVMIHPKQTRLSEDNAQDLLTGHTIALDGSDSFETRALVAKVCESLKIPLVSGAVNRFDGSITTLMPWEKSADGFPNPRYEDLFPNPPPIGSLPTCAEVGIMGAVTGIIGAMQAMEAVKVITGCGTPLVGRLLMMDGLSLQFQTISYRRKAAQ